MPAADRRTVDLRPALELVDPAGLVSWCRHVDGWGDASLRLPVFESWKTNTAVSLVPGRFELVTVFTPKPGAPVPPASRKLPAFVRADLLSR